MFAHTNFISHIVYKIRCRIKLTDEELQKIESLPQYKDAIIHHFNDCYTKGSYGCVQSNK